MFCIPPTLIADTVPYGMILRGTKAAKVASKETRIVISKCTLAMACCEKRVPDYTCIVCSSLVVGSWTKNIFVNYMFFTVQKLKDTVYPGHS